MQATAAGTVAAMTPDAKDLGITSSVAATVESTIEVSEDMEVTVNTTTSFLDPYGNVTSTTTTSFTHSENTAQDVLDDISRGKYGAPVDTPDAPMN